jgi:succinyl-diaminopimelate desuccinylase
MKGGLAVMLAIAERVQDPAVDLTFVFYECEEVGRQHNGLSRLLGERPDLLRADAAVLCEPTDGVAEVGCQGTLRCELTLTGARAHTARPWMGENAIHRLSEVLRRIADGQTRTPDIDGCTYRESLQAVSVSGGVAGNVVPDKVVLTINHRFAPDRSTADAMTFIREVLGDSLDEAKGDTLVLVDAADGALPGLSNPLMASLVKATNAEPRAKLGWTDVAFFAEQGVPALNLGPGDPTVAHMADEHVTRSSLERAYSALWQVVHQTP